ncbi:MAG: cytochrome P450, partial [Pseudomonadales bacterium]|nr:cytochrome P450 [Pseudomonadales bacterium]
MSEAIAQDPSAIPDAWSLPIEDVNPLQARLFQNDAHWGYFERLRAEDPVHLNESEDFGRYWSVTKFHDIMYVDTHHDIFSSEGGITIGPPISAPRDGFQTRMFIAMDPPKHDVQRATVSPVVAPSNLAKLESTIRQRAGSILDSLPVGETFNWVDKVSIELTTQMLATLFDFPFEDRRKLTRWSDVATAAPGTGIVESQEQRRE